MVRCMTSRKEAFVDNICPSIHLLYRSWTAGAYLHQSWCKRQGTRWIGHKLITPSQTYKWDKQLVTLLFTPRDNLEQSVYLMWMFVTGKILYTAWSKPMYARGEHVNSLQKCMDMQPSCCEACQPVQTTIGLILQPWENTHLTLTSHCASTGLQTLLT